MFRFCASLKICVDSRPSRAQKKIDDGVKVLERNLEAPRLAFFVINRLRRCRCCCCRRRRRRRRRRHYLDLRRASPIISRPPTTKTTLPDDPGRQTFSSKITWPSCIYV